MSLVDVIEARDIEQIHQALLSLLDRLKEILSELRDETEVELILRFRKRQGNAG